MVGLIFPCLAQTGPTAIFLEVPLMVQAPGYQSAVRAYHDGEDFFVEMANLWEELGYSVTREKMLLTAQDREQRFVIDFGRAQFTRANETPVSLKGDLLHSQGRYLVRAQALGQLFGSDVHFDETRLSLQLSSSAEHFNTFALGSRAYQGSEVPGPLRMGRERHLLGGLVASWHVTRQWHGDKLLYSDARVHFSSGMLGGAVSGILGRSAEASYLFDRPGSKMLTRIEAGRMGAVDGLRLSNLPLASLHLQRTLTLQGRAAPHAMAEVMLGGQVIDRTVADQRGRYRLRIPARYGTTEAIVRIQPLGGLPAYEQSHHLLIPPSLAPPGKFFYDAMLGDGGLINVSYGLHSRLTAHVTGQHHGPVTTGVIANPWPFVVLTGEVSWPLKMVNASASLWRRYYAVEATVTPYRSHALLTGHWRQIGLQLSATTEPHRGQQFSGALFWHGKSGTSARLHLHDASSWHVAAGHVTPVWGGVLHLGLFAKSPHLGGAEILFSSRGLGLGLNMAYDKAHKSFSGQITFQLRTSAFEVASRAHSGGTHVHSASGSISIGPEIRFSRALYGETAALIRVFEDYDGDGKLSNGEPILPDVDVQLFQVPLQRIGSGALRASFLEPYAAYQVQILEQSIRDPWLRPTPGYSFSFIADPGRTKRVDIPMRRIPLVRGIIQSVNLPPSRLLIRALQEGRPVGAAEVYRDGGFALRLEYGDYLLQVEDLVEDTVLTRQPLTVSARQRVIDLELNIDL